MKGPLRYNEKDMQLAVYMKNDASFGIHSLYANAVSRDEIFTLL